MTLPILFPLIIIQDLDSTTHVVYVILFHYIFIILYYYKINLKVEYIKINLKVEHIKSVFNLCKTFIIKFINVIMTYLVQNFSSCVSNSIRSKCLDMCKRKKAKTPHHHIPD